MRAFEKSKGTRRCRKAAVGGHAHGAGDRGSQVQAGDCWGASKGTGGVQGEALGWRQLTTRPTFVFCFLLLFVQNIFSLIVWLFNIVLMLIRFKLHPFSFRLKSSITFWRQRSHAALIWRCMWPCWTRKSLCCRKMLRNFVKSCMMVYPFHL